MKIAITATAPDLDANVDPRFGRCPFFLIVETDDLNFEAMENPNITQGSGAGIQSAQLMADKGVQHILTGNCGPNAHQTLAAANITVSVGCSGPIRQVVEQFKTGQFSAALNPNVPGHFGTGAASPQTSDQPNPGFGQGMGRGGGRGMGGGGGMGRGGGRGMGRGQGMRQGGGGMAGAMGEAFPQGAAAMSQATPASLSTNDELAILKQQAEEMVRQTQGIHERIRQLEQQGQTRAVAARVDTEKCTGCGICVNLCPVEAISLDNGVAVVDEGTCTACGLCVNECPNGAIALV